MAIAKVIFNGETQMDVTQDTVTAARMLSPYTATRADGVKITGSIATKTASDMTVSGATVTAQKGYYASNTSKTVASGTAGTPVATKGTVTSHAVTVTPSVTNTTGYITGSTKTGDSVKIYASDLVSGTKSITSNGTSDVTNYASVNVNVPGQTINNQNKTVTPLGSVQYVTADNGYTGLGTVTVNAIPAGTVNNPTITKTIQSGLHTATLTPSVTKEAGYVTSGTLTGSAVTVSASEIVSGSQSIWANGTVDVTNLAEVVVNVPTSDTVYNQDKTVDAPTYTEGNLVVTYDQGYTGLSSVTITPNSLASLDINASVGSVQNNSVVITPRVTVGDGSDGYVASGTYNGSSNTVTVSASDLVSGTRSITSNGNVDVTNYAAVSVNVPTGTTINNQTKTVNPGPDEIHVTPDAGYTGLGEVIVTPVYSGTIGTPVATKSPIDLDNHRVYITPSVQTSEGYTYYGDAVEVTASELVFGSITATYNQYVNAVNFAEVVVQVPGGGGLANEQLVNFIDYDGTILYSYSYDEWSRQASLPKNPTNHNDILIPQGWNWTKAQIDSQLSSNQNGIIVVGQNYTTVSGNTEIDVNLNSSEVLSPYLAIAVNGEVDVNWGDGIGGVSSGTSLSTTKFLSHTYNQPGEYTISISVNSGSFAFGGGSSNYAGVLSPVNTNNQRRFAGTYPGCIKALRIGDNCVIQDRAFNALRNCNYITIPSGITSIPLNAFRNCYSLSAIIIPSTVTSIGNSFCEGDRSLQYVSLPTGVTSYGTNLFNECSLLKALCIPNTSAAYISTASGLCNKCYSLRSLTLPKASTFTAFPDDFLYECYSLSTLTIPDYVTSLGSNTIRQCSSLKSIIVPSRVTSIGSACFSTCYGMEEYHFRSNTPPTLADTTVFQTIVSGTKIYVPRGKGNTYKTATNWSNWASYIEEEPA